MHIKVHKLSLVAISISIIGYRIEGCKPDLKLINYEVYNMPISVTEILFKSDARRHRPALAYYFWAHF